MNKILGIVVAVLTVICGVNAMAWDITEAANKIQSAADKASAKIDEAKLKNSAKSEAYKTDLEEKIAALKAKIEKWQAGDDAKSSEKLAAIAEAKASIERLKAKLKALAE